MQYCFFLFFKKIIHSCLLKIPITHRKGRNHKLKFIINCISARSATQILSITGKYTFRFINITRNRFYVTWLRSLPPVVFYQKNKPWKQEYLDTHHILFFSKHQMLQHAIFYQKLLFFVIFFKIFTRFVMLKTSFI